MGFPSNDLRVRAPQNWDPQKKPQLGAKLGDPEVSVRPILYTPQPPPNPQQALHLNLQV
jgi:hypothetical protein